MTGASAKTVRDGDPRPCVAHIIHRLDIGGMENGLVNLINHMPADRFRHAIICMTDYTDFRLRIRRDDVSLHALHKREGKDPQVHVRLWRLLRALQPDIVHTRNFGTLEAQVTAALSGVRARVHGEHGWDVGDLDGTRDRNRRLRRLMRPLVRHYIALSQHQKGYLRDAIGVPTARLSHIFNGVDTGRFAPTSEAFVPPFPEGFRGPGTFVIGSVMRMQAVKAPLDLARAFVALRERMPTEFPRLRLAMIGDGPLRGEVRQLLEQSGVAGQAWIPGAREDIPDCLRALDLFVLPSLAEGICNTILEAMATGLPVVATDVGGNPDLVQPGVTGVLVPAGDPDAIAAALMAYPGDPARTARQGVAARARAEAEFSMDAMVAGYMGVYDRVLGRR